MTKILLRWHLMVQMGRFDFLIFFHLPAFISHKSVKLLNFGNEIFKLNTYHELYHCYICDIIQGLLNKSLHNITNDSNSMKSNLESFIDLIHERIWSMAILSQNLQINYYKLYHCYIYNMIWQMIQWNVT